MLEILLKLKFRFFSLCQCVTSVYLQLFQPDKLRTIFSFLSTVTLVFSPFVMGGSEITSSSPFRTDAIISFPSTKSINLQNKIEWKILHSKYQLHAKLYMTRTFLKATFFYQQSTGNIVLV